MRERSAEPVLIAAAIVVVAVVLAALVFAGCGGERTTTDSEAPTPSRKSEVAAAPATQPGPLRKLARDLRRRGYATEFVPHAELPRREPIVFTHGSPEHRLRARLGLRIHLDRRASGYVYRYRTPRVAEAAAPSFLADTAGDGISSCGAWIYFRKAESVDGGAPWTRTVAGLLSRAIPGCSGGDGDSFGVTD